MFYNLWNQFQDVETACSGLLTGLDTNDCPTAPKATFIGDRFYYHLNEIGVKFSEAECICQNRNMKLASIKTQAEYEQAVQAISTV